MSEPKPTTPAPTFSIKREPVRVIMTLHSAEGLVLNVMPDGSVEFGPGFKDSDETAKLFWRTIGTAFYTTQSQIVADRCAAIVLGMVDPTMDPFCCEPLLKETAEKIRAEFKLER